MTVELQHRELPTRSSIGLPVMVGLATFAFVCWSIGTPSLWRDEAVTAQYALLGPSEILGLGAVVDAVHVPFYLFQWTWTSVFGTSEVALRMPSAIAIATSAGLLFSLARRYVTRNQALVTCGLYVALPPVARYAQEARATALVIALCVLSTLLLHRVLEATTPRFATWFAYGAVLATMSALSVVSLFTVIPHAALVFHRQRGRFPSWFMSSIPSVVVAGLIALFAAPQSDQLGWIPDPTVSRFFGALDELFGTRMIAIVILTLSAVFMFRALYSKVLSSQLWLIGFAATPVALWVVSQAVNMFAARYIEFTIPYYALIATLALRQTLMAVFIFLLVAAFGASSQWDIRQPSGHADNFRAAMRYIDVSARPGDIVDTEGWLAEAGRQYYMESTTPAPFTYVGPITAQSLLIGGIPCTPSSLDDVDRVWYLKINRGLPAGSEQDIHACDPDFGVRDTKSFGTLTIELFAR